MSPGLVSSPEVKDLFAAFVLAQSKVKGAVKESENPGFARGGKASKYADLASVRDACQEALSANGLGVIQSASTEFVADVTQVNLTTRIVHTSGQWIEGCVSARPVTGLPQAVGSAITYLRRYGLAAMVGVAPEDDDGNAGSGVKSDVKPATKPAEDAKAKAEAAEKERKALLDGLAKDLDGWPDGEIEALHQRVLHRAKPDKASGYSLADLRALKSAAQVNAPPSTEAAPTGSGETPPSAEQQGLLTQQRSRVAPDVWTTIAVAVMGDAKESEMTESQADLILERLAQEPDSGLPGFDGEGKAIKWIVCPKSCGVSVYWSKTKNGKNATFGADGKLHLFSCANK